MLIYHPAFDFYNGIFRILRLLDKMPDRIIEVDRIRILDFYLLFPSLLQDIQFPASARKFKAQLAAEANVYEELYYPKRIFLQLEPYQRTALSCLASHSLIDPVLLRDEKVKRTEMPLPAELGDVLRSRNNNSPEIELLSGPLADIDLYGKTGLKQRSDLFEYRYDPR